MKADAKTEAAVLAVMDAFVASYARGDAEGVMALHAADADVAVLAQGLKYVGPEQIRALVADDLVSFEAIHWALAAPSVSCAGAVAWVIADATATGQTNGQAVPLGAYRLTWVLERRGEQWLIMHAHVSAVANGE